MTGKAAAWNEWAQKKMAQEPWSNHRGIYDLPPISTQRQRPQPLKGSLRGDA